MTNVYIEPRPKGRHAGAPIDDYVVEDDEDHVLKIFKTQKEAIDWAKKEGHYPLIARVRHLSNKTRPDHWRPADSHVRSDRRTSIFDRLDELKLPSLGKPLTQKDIESAITEAMTEKERRSRGT
jgi:hypothetical protein